MLIAHSKGQSSKRSKLVINKLFYWIRQRDNGQTMTEYALILAAVAVVAVAGYMLLGTAIAAKLTTIIADL